MKNILLIFLCFLSFTLLGQVERMPNLTAKYFATQSGGGSGFWQLTGTFTDDAGVYDASGVQVGDVVFFSDGMYTFFLPVIEVVSAMHPTITVKVSNVGITQISSVPSGMKAIFHPTSKGYFPFVSGISNADQQVYNEYLMSLLDQASTCEQIITKTGHGFRKWTPVRWTGTTYVRPTHDTLVPDYIVVDSLTANTFKVANCGKYPTVLPDGLYWYTSASPGYSLVQDTTKVPLFQVIDSILVLQPLVGFNLGGNEAIRKDTFIIVATSANFSYNAITNPAARLNNIYLSCKGRTDTTIVAFLATPVWEEQKGVIYNIKNDSGLVAVFVLTNEHLSNLKRFYLLERGQTAQIQLLPDAANGGNYGWAVNVVWDDLANSKFIVQDSSYGVSAFYTDIKIKGTYIYACSPSLGRVAIYDAAFPKDTVKSFRPNFSGLNFLPTIVKTQGNDLYVLCLDDAGGSGESRIFKYNATDPLNPVLMWSRATGGGYYPSDFAINDTLIYIMRISNVEIISSLNNNKGNFGPGGTPNSIQYKDGKIYLFGRRTFSVLDTAYFSVFNASTIVPTLVARYKSALDSNYLGGYIDSDYIFLISNSNTTLLRSSNLSLVKRNKLPNVNQAVYHFPYSKYKAKAVKFNDYVIASSAASTYMYLFSYPGFNILNQQDMGENLMWFDLVGNTFHGIRGDTSQAPKQIVKGILNFNLH